MDELNMLDESNTVEVGNESTPEASALADAEQRLDAAHVSLAKAEETLQVAHAKADDEDLTGWLRAAATEALSQAERARGRAVAEVGAAAEDVAAAREQASGENNESTPSPAAESDEPTPFYDSPEEFLHEQLLPLYNRILDTKNGKWCRQWFLHPEAVSRVDALWRAWEHLRLDGQTGMSVWWKDHADVHMTVLLSQKGPFHACSSTRHTTPEPFPCDIAPEGWFPSASETPMQ